MPRKKACNAIYRMVEKYTHDVYANPNHHFDELNKARSIVDGIGMESVDNDRRPFHNDKGEETGYTEVETWRYLDSNLKEVTINVRWNVFYAGDVDDIKDRYDFTVEVF